MTENKVVPICPSCEIKGGMLGNNGQVMICTTCGYSGHVRDVLYFMNKIAYQTVETDNPSKEGLKWQRTSFKAQSNIQGLFIKIWECLKAKKFQKTK